MDLGPLDVEIGDLSVPHSHRVHIPRIRDALLAELSLRTRGTVGNHPPAGADALAAKIAHQVLGAARRAGPGGGAR